MNSTSKKKILIIAESIDVEDSSGTKGRVALIKNLYKSGYDLKVIHYTRKEIQLEGVQCVAIKEKRRNVLFLFSRIERLLRYRFGLELNYQIEKAFGFSFTLFNDRNSIIKALKKASNFEPDLVVTLSKGGSFRPHHALLKLPGLHDKWMAYIHDPYPMHSYPRPYDWVEPGHTQKRNFFLEVAQSSKYVAYPSQLLAEWMESYYPPLKGKAVIIPHQIDSKNLFTNEKPPFFKKDYFTVVHAGTLMDARNPMPLIKAYRSFLENYPQAKDHSQIVFLGGPSKYTTEFSKIKRDVPQFYFSERNVPFNTAKAVQNQASVNVILESAGTVSPFLPGKFPHCVGAGKPILLLGPFYSECKRLLGTDYPYWSEIEDVDQILRHLIKLYENWQKEQSYWQYGDLEEYLSEKHLKKVIDGLT